MRYIKILFSLLFMTHLSLLQSACPLDDVIEIPNSPFDTGTFPYGVAYSPLIAGRLFASVSNYFDHTLSVYTADTTTGDLTLVDNFSAGVNPTSITYSPVISGRLFAATANSGTNTISVYESNIATGVLTPVPGVSFFSGNGPVSVAYSPLVLGNLFAGSVNLIDSTITMYQVNTATGDFNTLFTELTFLNPHCIAFSPIVSGKLFAAVSADSAIAYYEVDTTTGSLSFIGATGINLGMSVAYSPLVNGKLYFMAAALLDDVIQIFEVDTTTGGVTFINDYPAGNSPTTVSFSPFIGGSLLFAAVGNLENTNNVYIYNVDPLTGVLSGITGSPFSSSDPTGTYGVGYSPMVSGGLFLAKTNSNLDTVSIFQHPASITVTVTSPSIVIKAGSSTTINATITGGAAPYTVVWTDGFTQVVNGTTISRTVSPTIRTTYCIAYVIDDNGCISGPSNCVTIGVRTGPGSC